MLFVCVGICSLSSFLVELLLLSVAVVACLLARSCEWLELFLVMMNAVLPRVDAGASGAIDVFHPASVRFVQSIAAVCDLLFLGQTVPLQGACCIVGRGGGMGVTDRAS